MVVNASGKTRISALNEQKILDAAQQVFADYGAHGATIDRIASLAGMSKPNLHYYFKTKDDLYRAVLRRTLDIWLDSFARLDPNGDPARELSTYISEKIRMAKDHPEASRVFANEILRGAPVLKDYLASDLRALVETKTKVIRHWIDAGKLAPVDPVHLIFLIWAATQHYADFLPQVTAILGVSELSDDHYTDVEKSLHQIILNGVLPR